MKMTLTSYYNNLPVASAPKTEFIKCVSSRCNLDPYTVRLWVKGKAKPRNPEHIKILAEVTGICETNLFE